jgi:DNA-binding MarR family transcriptional regulator
MHDDEAGLLFRFFNEIGIIEQLSRAMFEARLPDGFLVSHFAVLNHLSRVRDGQTPLAIARAFQVPKTTMTHTLSGLEKAGLVEMRPNPEDGRSKQVWLTEAGRRFRADAIAALAPYLARIAGVIAPARVAEALPLLTELREYLDRARD